MSLRGLTIAITGSRRTSELAKVVENFGGKSYIAPIVGIEANLGKPNEAIIEFINRIIKQESGYVIFMTVPDVFSLMELARSIGMEDALLTSLKKATTVARSAKPQTILSRFGIKVDLIPQENTIKGILDLLKDKDMSSNLPYPNSVEKKQAIE